jgi:hypothetical protein
MSRLLALAPAALLLASCGRPDEVDITRTASGTIPGATGAPPLSVPALVGLGLMLDPSALKANGIAPSDVDSAKLVGLRLAVTNGTTFEAWLDAVTFFVEAQGLPRVLVAQKTGIRSLPSGTTVVELATPGVDLKPYVLAPSAVVRVEAAGSQPPAATTIEATATIRVNVNVTGLLH